MFRLAEIVTMNRSTVTRREVLDASALCDFGVVAERLGTDSSGTDSERTGFPGQLFDRGRVADVVTGN
jgi:hypothetical protein